MPKAQKWKWHPVLKYYLEEHAITVRQLSSISGVNLSSMWAYLSMRIRIPSSAAVKLANVMGASPELLTLGTWYKPKKKTLSAGCIEARLRLLPDGSELTNPVDILVADEECSMAPCILEQAISTMTPRCRAAFEMRIGMSGNTGHISFEEIGKELGVTRARAHSMFTAGSRKVIEALRLRRDRAESGSIDKFIDVEKVAEVLADQRDESVAPIVKKRKGAHRAKKRRRICRRHEKQGAE